MLQGKQKSYCFECFATMPDANSGKGWLEGKLLYEEVSDGSVKRSESVKGGILPHDNKTPGRATR